MKKSKIILTVFTLLILISVSSVSNVQAMMGGGFGNGLLGGLFGIFGMGTGNQGMFSSNMSFGMGPGMGSNSQNYQGYPYNGSGNMGRNMMGSGMSGSGMYGSGMSNNGMYGNQISPNQPMNQQEQNNSYNLQAEIDFEDGELRKIAVEFINKQLGEQYTVGDILVFNNSPYYISVIDRKTGNGAFELLYDPYSNRFSPAPGPNRMWNLNNAGTGVNQNKNVNTTVNLSREESVEQAEYFLQENGSQLTVESEGQLFNGYYTFYTGVGDKTVGMISVNSGSGEVWFHNWHGQVDRVIRDN